MEQEKTEKRLLNIASFARLYFQLKGVVYENSRNGREAADKYFRLALRKGKVDSKTFIQAKELHLKQIADELDSLIQNSDDESVVEK